jgi:hypothetical protein
VLVPVGLGATGVVVDPPPQAEQPTTTIIDPSVKHVDRIVLLSKGEDNLPSIIRKPFSAATRR